MDDNLITKNPKIKFKRILSDADKYNSTKTNDSTSNKSNDSESEKEKQLRRKYDIEFKQFSRSKSSSHIFKKQKLNYPSVKEENDEGNDEKIDNDIKKLHFLNEQIQSEGFDNIEEHFLEHKPKKLTKSSKALSVMDPVIEASDTKDEIDFEDLKIAPFKKLKLVTDNKEDKQIKTNTDTASLHIPLTTNLDYEEPIAEDNKEDEVEETKCLRKCSSIKRIAEFVDKSDMIDEPKAAKDIITEEIKEDSEHEENIVEVDEIMKSEKSK